MPTFIAIHRCFRPFFQWCSIGVAILFFGAISTASANTVDQLRVVIEEVPVSKIPGIILLVEGPEVSFHGARGYADKKNKKPIQMEHTLRAASICKTYVAALSIMAANEGLINFDSPIDQYLHPEVLEKLPDGLRPSIRQLLNHTSGVPDYYGVRFYLQDWKRTEPLTTELVLHAIRGKKAVMMPGERFSYSNTNYHLLALILEDIYQVPLATLLRERIFEPLNLETTYYNQHFPPGDEIHGYGSPLRPWKDTYNWRENSGPDGGMIASAADLAIWMRALFSPAGRFSDIGIDMSKNPVVDKERVFQGMGVEILQSRNGVKIMGHTGGADGYLTAAFYVKTTDTVMVLHMNKSNTKIFNSILSKILKIITNN